MAWQRISPAATYRAAAAFSPCHPHRSRTPVYYVARPVSWHSWRLEIHLANTLHSTATSVVVIWWAATTETKVTKRLCSLDVELCFVLRLFVTSRLYILAHVENIIKKSLRDYIFKRRISRNHIMHLAVTWIRYQIVCIRVARTNIHVQCKPITK